jgi:hypothetical protein
VGAVRAIPDAIRVEAFAAARRMGYRSHFIERGYEIWQSRRAPERCYFLGKDGPPKDCSCDPCRLTLLGNYFDQVATNFAMVRGR